MSIPFTTLPRIQVIGKDSGNLVNYTATVYYEI